VITVRFKMKKTLFAQHCCSDVYPQVTLNIYTFENVAYHILHTRLPHFTHRTLTNWFDHKTHLYRYVASSLLAYLDLFAYTFVGIFAFIGRQCWHLIKTIDLLAYLSLSLLLTNLCQYEHNIDILWFMYQPTEAVRQYMRFTLMG